MILQIHMKKGRQDYAIITATVYTKGLSKILVVQCKEWKP